MEQASSSNTLKVRSASPTLDLSKVSQGGNDRDSMKTSRSSIGSSRNPSSARSTKGSARTPRNLHIFDAVTKQMLFFLHDETTLSNPENCEIIPQDVFYYLESFFQSARIHPTIKAVEKITLHLKTSKDNETAKLDITIENQKITSATLVTTNIGTYHRWRDHKKPIQKALSRFTSKVSLETKNKKEARLILKKPRRNSEEFSIANVEKNIKAHLSTGSEKPESTVLPNEKQEGIVEITVSQTSFLELKFDETRCNILEANFDGSVPEQQRLIKDLIKKISPEATFKIIESSFAEYSDNSDDDEEIGETTGDTSSAPLSARSQTTGAIYVTHLFNYSIKDLVTFSEKGDTQINEKFKQLKEGYLRNKIQRLKVNKKGNLYNTVNLGDSSSLLNAKSRYGQALTSKNLIVDLERLLDNVGWFSKRFFNSGKAYRALKAELETMKKDWMTKQTAKPVKPLLRKHSGEKFSQEESDNKVKTVFNSKKTLGQFISSDLKLSRSEKNLYLSIFNAAANNSKDEKVLVAAHNLAVTAVNQSDFALAH